MINKDRVIGIGVDIEETSRFDNLDRHVDRIFLERIFTHNELTYCFSKKNPAPHLAARYAGKEAITKALYDLGKPMFTYKDIEIIHDKKGVPRVKVNTNWGSRFRIQISLSHCRDKAIAFSIIMDQSKIKKTK